MKNNLDRNWKAWLAAHSEDDGSPLYKKLALFVMKEFENEVWMPGETLPSVREACRRLGISRNTAVSCFAFLEAQGVIRVEPRKRAVFVKPAQNEVSPDWHGLFSRSGILVPPVAVHHQKKQVLLQDGAVNLSRRMDAGWDGLESLRFTETYAERALASLRAGRFPDLYDEHGLLPLREQLCDWLRASGIRCEPGEILVVSRRMQVYNLLSEVFLSPGISACYERVSFLNFYRAGVMRSARRILLPTDEKGLDIGPMRLAKGPRILFIQPTGSEPCGTVTNPERREEIMAFCTAQRVPVVEDAVMDPLQKERLPSLKSMDRTGCVIHIGGIHGPLTPGMSLDWVAAPKPVINALLTVVRREAQFPSEMNQMILCEVLRDGKLAEYFGLQRAALRKKRAECEAILKEHLGGLATWSRDQAWGRIWLVFREGISVRRLYAERQDVNFFPGEFYGDASDRAMLLYIFCARETFEEGVRRLRRLIGKVCGI